MASSFMKSSKEAFPLLTLGSLFLSHFLLFPLDHFSFESPSSTIVDTRSSSSEKGKGKSDVEENGRGNIGKQFLEITEADDNSSSLLLSHVPDDFYSHLYVVSTQSYLNEVDSPIGSRNPESPDYSKASIIVPALPSLPSADDSVTDALASLKRQGAQIFVVDEFAEDVDVSAFFREGMKRDEDDKEKQKLGFDAEPTDGAGESGDSSGSGR